MTYVPSSASACHLPERNAIPFDAMKTEFSSANIHIMCSSLCWALWAHSGLCPLGRQTLRSGPGHSDEDYLHTWSSAKCGALIVWWSLHPSPIPRISWGLIVLNCSMSGPPYCLFQSVLEALDSWEWGKHKSRAAKLLTFMSMLEATRGELEEGRSCRQNGPSPQQPGSEKLRQAWKGAPQLAGAHVCLRGHGEEPLSAAVDRLRRAAPHPGWRTPPGARSCSMLSSAAQRELKRAFPLKRCGLRAALSPPDHFPFRLQLSLLRTTSPTCFPDLRLSRQTLA